MNAAFVPDGGALYVARTGDGRPTGPGRRWRTVGAGLVGAVQGSLPPDARGWRRGAGGHNHGGDAYGCRCGNGRNPLVGRQRCGRRCADPAGGWNVSDGHLGRRAAAHRHGIGRRAGAARDGSPDPRPAAHRDGDQLCPHRPTSRRPQSADGPALRAGAEALQASPLRQALGTDNASVSPDGTRLALNRVVVRPGDRIGTRPIEVEVQELGRRVLPFAGRRVLATRLFEAQDSPKRSPRWSPDGRWLTVETKSGHLFLDADTLDTAGTLPCAYASGIVWSPDGRLICACSWEKAALLPVSEVEGLMSTG